MIHIIFRAVLGIFWFVTAGLNFFWDNKTYALLYSLLGISFLFSAYAHWKKEAADSEKKTKKNPPKKYRKSMKKS